MEWSPKVGGWTMHCVSTASEWLMALRCKTRSRGLSLIWKLLFSQLSWCYLHISFIFSLDLTLLSLVPEFRNLTFESPQIRLIVNRSNSVLDVRCLVDILCWIRLKISLDAMLACLCINIHFREEEVEGYSSSGSLLAWSNISLWLNKICSE